MGRRLLNGRWLWMLQWAGVDAHGKAWDDSEEPTRNVSIDLITEWKAAQQAEAAAPHINVNVSALDTLVQRTMANSVMREDGNSASGEIHTKQLDILGLLDVAVYYMETIAARYNLEIKKARNPSDNVTTSELRITEPEVVADFCNFEAFVPRRTGARSWRVSNKGYDLRIVGVVKLRFYDNKHLKGTVTFETSYQTLFVNGVTGELRGPHLGPSSTEPIATEAHRAKVRAFLREHVPTWAPTHPLVVAGWHELPPNRWFV